MVPVNCFDSCKHKTAYSKLFFCLSWFHSILLERSKFKSLGFNATYEFNDSDFLICKDLIKVLLEEYPNRIPFDALKYLIGEAYYGGRVTDDWDRKILIVYMDAFFSTNATEEENFKLSILEEYSIPNNASFSSHVSYIQHLPSFDNSHVFGQHPNAELSSQVLEANNLLQSISMLQPDHECLSTATSDTSISEQFVFTKFDGLPDAISSEEVNQYLQTSSDADAIKTVLAHEVENYKIMLSIVHETTQNLKKAMRGQILMTSELETSLSFILQNRVPLEWLQIYPSSRPFDSWKKDLYRRIKQLRSWIESGSPKIFWLPGFTNPLGFLTAVLQTFARSKHISIDSLSWQYIVKENKDETIVTRPEDGVYVTGLFLEGAKWDSESHSLAEPESMKLYSTMPLIHFKPIESRRKCHMDAYHCPLYLSPVRSGTPQRPSFVIAVDLDGGDKESDHWTKRGVALLLSTTE